MPRALCKECGHEQWWSNKRGVRLANIPCEACGGELRRPTKEERRKWSKARWAKINQELAVYRESLVLKAEESKDE